MSHLLKCHEITKTDFIRGQGCWLYDSQGRGYLDFEAGIWCTVLGHNHPRVNQAILQQIEQVTHLGTRYPNQVVEEAAAAVLETLGMPQGKTVFLSSGSEAVEFAVQAARQFTGQPLLLTLSDSFLGSYGSAGKKRPDEWHCLDWS
ncbi:MAG: aminotransferase class III-fold pyridoxal phosphate-dependent enzyme, partial [Chloroflexi bacterium]